jgi:TonB family protein
VNSSLFGPLHAFDRRIRGVPLYFPGSQLDEQVARGSLVSTNAKIDGKTAQAYMTLSDIADAVARKRTNPDREAVITHRILPEYSTDGRKARIQGTVELLIIVKADGTVDFQSVRKSLGYGLDQKAIDAVKNWKFKPANKRWYSC